MEWKGKIKEKLLVRIILKLNFNIEMPLNIPPFHPNWHLMLCLVPNSLTPRTVLEMADQNQSYVALRISCLSWSLEQKMKKQWSHQTNSVQRQLSESKINLQLVRKSQKGLLTAIKKRLIIKKTFYTLKDSIPLHFHTPFLPQEV